MEISRPVAGKALQKAFIKLNAFFIILLTFKNKLIFLIFNRFLQK
jgi:hypothetical protein